MGGEVREGSDRVMLVPGNREGDKLRLDMAKSGDELRSVTASILAAAREQFERSFWWSRRKGYANDDQRTAILFALLRRLEEHTLRFGNPAVLGSEPGVQAFSYDVWFHEWRAKPVKRNEPVNMEMVPLAKYWRDQVVRPEASRHDLVRRYGVREAAKRKNPLLKPFPSPRFGFASAPNGFSFTEHVEPSPTGQPDTVTWTVAVFDDELQVSARIATYTGLPEICAPDLSDEKVRLPEVSKIAYLRRTARIFADSFLMAGVTTFKETMATVVVEGNRAKTRWAGFARTGLLIAVVVLLVYSAGVFITGRVAAQTQAAATVFAGTTICDHGKETVLIRGIATDARVRYSILRDGVPFRDVAMTVIPHIAPSPDELRDPKSQMTMTYAESVRVLDRDVLPGDHHMYQFVIRHPSPLFSFLKYEVPNPIEVTVGTCP
jgi:hypothetical protein